jgi:cytochrome c oxidase cbb3-type subunit 3
MTRLIVFPFAVLLVVSACEREKRDLHQSGAVPQPMTVTDLYPGGAKPPSDQPSPYEKNAYALSQGKMFFQSYNCTGCHANGGGGMGPALMDDQWIYGYLPDQIYLSIVEGRPQGMPTFRGKIPDEQVRQIAAYIRSMGGLAPKAASPSRDDHMMGKPPESSTPKQKPVNTTGPAAY